MKKEEMMRIAEELIGKAQPAYLATVDENNFPQIRAVENLRNSEKFPIEAKVLQEYEPGIRPYISTNTSSEKVKQINENNKVAMYFCLPNDYKGIMIQGELEIVDDIELKKKMWYDDLERYYREGPSDPDYTLLRLKPKTMKTWYKAQKNKLQISEFK